MTQVDFAKLADALKAAGFKLAPLKQPKASTKMPRADYLASIKAKFAKIGIKLTLDPKTDRFVDVLPAKGWIALGRVPAKGTHNINGLFHKSQTNALAQ